MWSRVIKHIRNSPNHQKRSAWPNRFVSRRGGSSTPEIFYRSLNFKACTRLAAKHPPGTFISQSSTCIPNNTAQGLGHSARRHSPAIMRAYIAAHTLDCIGGCAVPLLHSTVSPRRLDRRVCTISRTLDSVSPWPHRMHIYLRASREDPHPCRQAPSGHL